MANTLTNLNFTILAQKALEAFVSAMVPITAFASNFGEGEVQRGDKVKVAFVDAASAAQLFVAAAGYQIQDSQASGLDISINRRVYVSWGLTTQELANNPQLTLERFARQKGFQLAKFALQDIWSVVTQANYGNAIWSGTQDMFNSDDVADIEAAVDESLWPATDRALILRPTYHSAVTKDAKIAGTIGLQESAVLQRSQVPMVHNFNLHKSPFVPANPDAQLRGMVVHPDAILIASRVLVPEDPSKIIRFERLADPMGSGLTCAFREWTDPVLDQTNRVLEFTYGFLPGNKTGLRRIVAAGQ